MSIIFPHNLIFPELTLLFIVKVYFLLTLKVENERVNIFSFKLKERMLIKNWRVYLTQQLDKIQSNHYAILTGFVLKTEYTNELKKLFDQTP